MVKHAWVQSPIWGRVGAGEWMGGEDLGTGRINSLKKLCHKGEQKKWVGRVE